MDARPHSPRPRGPAPTLGMSLRQARRRRGLKRSEVARQARIPSRYIAALEADDFAALPEGAFRATYRRQYMAFLGMPPLFDDVEAGAPPALPGGEVEAEAEPELSASATIPRNDELPIGRLMVTGFALTLLTVLVLKVGSLLVESRVVAEVDTSPVAAAMGAVVPTATPPKAGPADELVATAGGAVVPAAAVAADAAPSADEDAGAADDAAAVLPGQTVRVRAIEPVRIRATTGETVAHKGILRAGKVLELQSEETIAVDIADLTRVRLYLGDERIEPLHNLSKGRRLVFVPTSDRD